MKENKNSEQTFHITQKALVLNGEGKFLVMRRSETTPSNPLKWDLPGGLLEFGEDPTEGIIREVKEESGLSVSRPKPYDIYAIKYPSGFWVSVAYECRTESSEVVLSYEHSDYKWINFEELAKLSASEKTVRFVGNFFKK